MYSLTANWGKAVGKGFAQNTAKVFIFQYWLNWGKAVGKGYAQNTSTVCFIFQYQFLWQNLGQLYMSWLWAKDCTIGTTRLCGKQSSSIGTTRLCGKQSSSIGTTRLCGKQSSSIGISRLCGKQSSTIWRKVINAVFNCIYSLVSHQISWQSHLK